jgi:hypothetical protein
VEFRVEDSNEQAGADPALVGALDPARIEAYRLNLRGAEFAPVPVNGKMKKPPMEGWQRLGDATEHEIRRWTRVWPSAPSTGILTRRTPCLDVDILDPEAADAVERLARERYEELGTFLVRTGCWPKRAFVFRTDVPFPKVTLNLAGPLGPEKNERLEFLADGQQLVVDGIHSEIGRLYSWHAERRPGDFTREDMPPIDEAQARSLVNDAAALLIRDFGYARKGTTPKPKAKGNGQAPDTSPADWTIDFADHDSLVPAAMRLLKSGMDDASLVNFFRDNVEALTGIDEARRARRLKEIPGIVSSARLKVDAAKDDRVPDPAPAPATDPADAELERLARLPLIQYGRERKAAAEALGVGSVSILDRAVAAKRAELSPDDGADGLPGRPITFDEIEPCAEPVDGAALLTDLSSTVGSYVIMNKDQRDAVALWATHAFAHDFRDTSPPLVIKSPAMRSGKTKLVEVLERLVPRPLFVSGITASFLERAIEAHRPTLLIDEYDALTSGDPALAEAARAQLNRSAKRRGARVGKSVPLPGGGYESRLFSTWAPTVIAGIGDPPGTIRDRAVVIDLKRKLSSEKVKPLRERDGADLAILRSRIARWVGDNELRLRSLTPAALAVDNDRAKDMWEPLLAVADIAGGDDWPKRAREAGQALAVASEAETADADVKLILLADIRDIFAAAFPPDHPDHKATREGPGRPSDGPRLASKRLLEELHGLEERP